MSEVDSLYIFMVKLSYKTNSTERNVSMKKLIAILISLFLFIPTTLVSAENWQQEITVTYNGELIEFDVEPKIVNGRTMVPFRKIFETLGGTVNFDGATKTVSSAIEGTTLSFVIGEYEALLKNSDGEKKITLDAAPVIVDNYTLVPVRFVAEAAGLKVNWDDYYKEVVIIDTAKWKEQIVKKSGFLKKYLDEDIMSLADAPIESKSEVKLNLSFSLKNASYIEEFSKNGIKNIDISVGFKIVSDEYFDGLTSKSQNTIDVDLSSLHKLMKKLAGKNISDEEETKINNVFKNHNFNLEIMADENYNIYLNGGDVAKIIEALGGEELNSDILNNYLKISSFKNNADFDFTKVNSVWDLIEEYINENNEMTSTDVKMLDYILTVCADLYSDENVKVWENGNGQTYITFDITKDDYKKSMEKIILSMWEYDEDSGLSDEEKAYVKEQIDEMLKTVDIFDISVTGTVKIKDAYTQSSDLNVYLKINDLVISEEDKASASIGFDMSIKENSSVSSVKTENKIPENVVDLQNIN